MYMKKLFIFLGLFGGLFGSALVFGGEPLMLINPGRETFLNFPSATVGNEKTVTVFLPESSVPLRQRYPVVYMLGVGPKSAPQAQAHLETMRQKAILVGVNFDEKELADTEKIVRFFSRELVPYIDTNYFTLDEAAGRGVAAAGAEGAKAAAALLAQKNLFTRAVVLNGGTEPVSLAGADPSLRVLLAGERAQAIVWQQTLTDMDKVFGPDFITVLGTDMNLWDALDLNYLFAPEDTLSVKKLKGAVVPAKISIQNDEKSRLNVKALLANGNEYDFIPLQLRLSPPYLNWNAAEGELSLISGAEKGTVKIRAFVDNKKFQTKIRLKK